jgi:hypothetical protein
MRTLRFLAAILLVMLTLTGTLAAQAQTAPSQYFAQTGHTVQGDFLRFFNAHGKLEIFGYPMTEAFVVSGRQVQYFQRVRMELYPENPDLRRIQLGKLGVELGYTMPPMPVASIPATNDSNRRYYSQTGHTVSLAFLKYFDSHGGLDIFGYPITEFVSEGGRTAQYFERARMAWHAELPSDQRVQLGNLGEIYATTRLDPSLLQFVAPGILASNAPQVTSLRVTASLNQSITGVAGQQTLHVYVMDQRGKAVQGAPSAAVVQFPSGPRTLTLPATDERGHAATKFDLQQLKPGQLIVVQVRSSWATLVTETQTSFFVWW